MAVTTTVTSANFTGTGVSSSYAPGFYVNSSDQVQVYVNGVLKTLGVDYAVNGVGVSAGCTIVGTFAGGSAVYIERVTPITQLVDTQNNETILEDVLDAEFDKLTMIAQEIGGVAARALVFPKGETGQTLASAASRAGKYLGFDGVGALATLPGTPGVPDLSLLTFSQAGVGAVLRTALAKMREQVSVKDFGAIGDGVSDDTVSIQNAINSGAALIFLPAGVYKISSALNVNSTAFLVGEGVWRTFILQSNPAANGVNFNPGYASGGGLRGISIHAVSTNPGQTKSSGVGLKLNRGNGAWLAEQFDVNGFATGIQSASNFYVFFRDFQVLNASTAGIYLAQKPAIGGYLDSAGVFFSTAKVSNYGTLSANAGSVGMLIEFAAGDHYTSIDCTSFDIGLKIAPPATQFIAHLFFDRVLADTSDTHSWIVDSTNGAITNINCVDCWAAFSTAGYGIWLKGATNDLDDFKWNGGNIRENGQHGVFCTWGKNIRFSNVAIAANGKLTTLTYNGVYLSGAGCQSFSLSDSSVGNFSTSALHKQLHNVYIDAAVTARVSINDCDLSAPGAGGSPLINLAAGATVRLAGNLPIQSGLNRPGADLERGCTAANVAPNSTVYLGPNGAVAAETNALVMAGFTGAVRRLYVACSVTPGAGQTFTVTLRVNNVDTAITGTITDGIFAVDLPGLVNVAVGDVISIKLVTSVTAAASAFRWFFEIGM